MPGGGGARGTAVEPASVALVRELAYFAPAGLLREQKPWAAKVINAFLFCPWRNAAYRAQLSSRSVWGTSAAGS